MLSHQQQRTLYLAKLDRWTDQNVYVRVNTLGEMLLNLHYEGSNTDVIHDVHMPHMDEDEYFEPMQYFMISEYLAERMLEHGLTRDAIIELTDGTYIWVRCGCGYALSDDLAKYFEN